MLNPTRPRSRREAAALSILAKRFGIWRGPGAWRAWLLVAVLIATVILQLLTQYALNYWNRDFFNAIGRKDGAELWTQALRFVPLAAASLALTVFSVWGRMTMQRIWRAWLSNHLYDYWLKDDRYVRLRFVAGDYDSPGIPHRRGRQDRHRSAGRPRASGCCSRCSMP